MRTYLLWLAMVALLTASKPKPTNTSSYTLKGPTVPTSACAFVAIGGPGEVDELTIRVGTQVSPEEGVFLLTYQKPASAPISAYKATMISYSYLAYGTSYNANYDTDQRCTLTQTRDGGYSGTFRGTCTGEGMSTPERSTVIGTFTHILDVKTIHH